MQGNKRDLFQSITKNEKEVRKKERTMSGNRYYSSVLLSGLLTLRSFYSLFCW